MIDLHCHSHYSDGALSPAELIAMAANNNLKMLALTDHDCVGGLEEMHRLGQAQGIRIISGVELSVNWKKNEIHVLGLAIDYQQPELLKAIAQQQMQRQLRASKIAEALEYLKVDNLYQKVTQLAEKGTLTRPHFAQVLVEEGICTTINDAFKFYLKRGKPGFVPTDWMSLEQAVSTIRQSGGIAVLAHPLHYQFTATKLNLLIEQFKQYGGKALEVINGFMLKNQVKRLSDACEKYGLHASTGSDFHALGKSRCLLGKQSLMPQSLNPVWDLFMENN